MKINYSLNSLKLVILLLAFFLSPHIIVKAQSVANYSFSSSTSGTLDDLSVGATSIMSGTNDDAATAVFPIGFNFPYMGGSYSHFSANSNGQFLFHTSGGATPIGTNVTPSAGIPNLFPMTGDNEVNNGMRYVVLGTAPNRKFVLEWNQFYVYYTNITNAGNMQLWLDEATGKIDFIYGEIYNSSASTVTRSIGIATGTSATTQGSVTVLASPTYAASATLTVNTFAAGSGTTTGSPLIADLGTNVVGSRRVYTFTPAPVTAPTSLTFSGISPTGMTLNWVDNATTELGYRIFKSTDGITYTLANQMAANSTTFAATGLSPNTLYYWKVIAYAETESTAITGNQSTNPASLAAGIYTVGAGGTYDNLTIAFADINAQGLTGNVELQLITGYPATPETYPILSCNSGSTTTYSVKVYPTVAGLSITSANATGTLSLNGATNLTFDGRINQAGAKDLVISNTNVGASYAVQFVNDAKSNTLQYLTIHSTNNSTSSGTIVFAGSTGTTGNDNNTIDNCDIMDGSSTPLNGIYSAGTSTTIDNSGNIVSNSNIFNYFGSGSNSNGVLLANNSSSWTINANKFYQTATRTITAGSQHRAINVITASGNGYVISNNTIGFASSTATGVTTYNGAFAGRFFGIELTASNSGTASSIQGNTVTGISLTTTSGSTAAPGIFAGISVLGGTVSVGSSTPNIIGASSGTGAISISTSTTANAFGIHASSTGTLNVVNNTVGAINAAGTTAGTTCGIVGINTTGASVATTITGNVIGGATANSIASGTLGLTTTSGTVSGIAAAGSTTALTITGNTVNNITNNAHNVSSNLYGIISINSPTTSVISNNTISNTILAAGTISNLDVASPTTLTSSNNTIFNAYISGASGTIYGMKSATTQYTYNTNSIHDLTIGANSGSASSVVYGIYNAGSPTVENALNNQIYNLSITGANTSTSNIVMGIYSNTSASSVKNFSSNTINGLSFANSSTGTAIINGISTSLGTTISVSKNKIYNLSSSGATSTVNGILAASGTTVNIYNNILGDLKAPSASAIDAIRGISVTSAATNSNYRVYYNSVHLTASSTGTNFGTSGIYHVVNATATTAALDLRNNIIINESTPAGTGFTVAYRLSGTALNNYNTSSNRNMYYAGVPSATNLVMYDGTTSYQTITAYQAAVLPRDVNSITGEASFIATGYNTPGNFFISTTPSNIDYLKPVVGISTQVESGGINITTPLITDDYSSVIRQGNAGYSGTGTSPDLGAFEFEGVSPAPIITLNSVTPPTVSQCVAAARLVSVNITTTAGTIAGATIGYAIDGVAQTNILMTNVSGSTWEATIPVPTPANAVITWGVAATNTLGLNGSYTGTTYSDEPLTGVTASANASATTICEGSPSTLTATLTKTGTIIVGSGSTVSGSTPGQNPFYGGYGGVKTQYLIRASELSALGLTAGNITQLSLNITTAGSTLSGFAISAENSPLTVLTTNIENVGTQVFSTASFVPTVGVNNFPFSTPLNWDGTSSIIISFCWSNNNASNTASQLLINNTSFVSGNARYVDSKTSAEVCGYTGNTTPSGWNGSSTTVSSRPIFTFIGNQGPAIQSISWSDGATTIGTSNPLAVSPIVTTTYSVTITAAGCTVNPLPTVDVTVNPLPTAPTAANSVQCGTQIPTASVTSTSGLTTPTFIWYDAATAGTALQTNTSTTFLSTIAATTTMYVAESNTSTGCESPRTAITISVNAADGISATPSLVSLCLGSDLTLTAANTNPTPNQTYTYSWISTTGSGVETATAGTSITVTPTSIGTFTYDLSAVDGGCSAIASTVVTVNSLPMAPTVGSSSAAICIGNSVNLTSTPASSEFVIAATNESFETFPPADWTFINAGTGNSWTSNTNATYAHTGTKSMLYAYNSSNPANAWAISPSKNMIAGQTYTISFWYRVYSTSYPEMLKVTVGNSPSVLAQTTTLWDNNGGSSLSNTTYAQATITYTPLTSGQFYLGFNSYSATNMWNLYIDDISIEQSVEPSYTYAWTSSPAGFTSTIQNPTGVTPSVTTNYTVTATNTAGCSSTGVTTVTVNALPTVDAGLDVPVCVGSQVTLVGAGATSYAWNNGVTDNTAFTATGSGATTYTVTGTDANGCSNTDQVIVTVNALPTVNAGVDQAICSGASATLTGSGTATSYVWNNSVTDGVSFMPAGTATYTATGTDANGCINTDQVVVTVNSLPTVNAGADVAVCDGLPLTLSGAGAVSYTWDNGITDNTPFTPTMTAVYTVTGTDANGCIGTDMVTATVNTLPIVDAGTDATFCEGADVVLAGSGATSYAWDNGITDNTTFQASITTVYTVTGTDINGCINTDQVTINVNANPVIDAGIDTAVCNGASIMLNGVGATTLTWDNGITDGVSFIPTNTATYTLIGTNGNGCIGTDMVTVTVNVLPTVDAGSDVAICSGNTVTLNGAGAVSFAWDNGVTNNVAFTPTGTMTYTTTGTDVNGCIGTDMVTVTVNALPTPTVSNTAGTLTTQSATSYVWINCATNTPVSGATSQTFVPTVNGSYAVIATNANGCSDTSACINITGIGIKELVDNSLNVYPNPTNGNITIDFTGTNATIELVDAQGKLLITQAITTGETISLSEYERGIYFLKFSSENGTALQRIVKN